MKKCSICGSLNEENGYSAETDLPVCYRCCGYEDAAALMLRDKWTLYLTRDKEKRYVLTNWPGTFRVFPSNISGGRHNIARTQTRVSFSFGGRKWYGTQYGDMSEICYCRAGKYEVELPNEE